jgi:putative methanogenesis marker 16 metalloprotein
VEAKTVLVDIETDCGSSLQAEIGLDEMPYARLNGSRHAFKNYSAFVNAGSEIVNTIFHSRGFAPFCSEATFSGCGLLSPLKNDPLLESIGVGSRVLINGAQGFVSGTGTRSSRERPNLSGSADMHRMDPEYMGGFVTSAGPECICSWAVPIPIISNSILEEIARQDREIALPVNDVCSRTAMGSADYGDVWTGVDLAVQFEPDRCALCPSCLVAEACPMGAVSREPGKAASRIDALCFHCGICVGACPGRAFRCRLGSIRMKSPGEKTRDIPVVLRQSDRLRAIKLAEDLKRRIIEGSFRIAEPVERI